VVEKAGHARRGDERRPSSRDAVSATGAVGPAQRGLRIAIVGAESTGKTTLARDLATTWSETGRRVALVEEALRAWCDAAGRTPRRDEQPGILAEQHRRIEAAAGAHDIVICDTTGLMTHVYSDLLFDDRSLEDIAVERHRGMAATLLTAIDLPWVADGHQRDGEHVRVPVDDRLRALLVRHGLAFSVVGGEGPARLAQACAALAAVPALRALGLPAQACARAPGGLFTRLARPPADASALRGRGWICECCVPEAEQALLAQQRGGRHGNRPG